MKLHCTIKRGCENVCIGFGGRVELSATVGHSQSRSSAATKVMVNVCTSLIRVCQLMRKPFYNDVQQSDSVAIDFYW